MQDVIDPTQTSRRWWIPLLGVALVATLVTVFLFVNLAPASPLEVAERYLAARDAYDSEAARALIAEGASLRDMPVIDIDEFDAGFEMLSSYEFSYDPFECALSRPEGWVTCNYALDTALNDPVGHPPVSGKIFLYINDGKIDELINEFPFDVYGSEVFRPFIAWLTLEHGAEAIDRLYRELPDGVITPRLDPEALEYARTILADYRESLLP